MCEDFYFHSELNILSTLFWIRSSSSVTDKLCIQLKSRSKHNWCLLSEQYCVNKALYSFKLITYIHAYRRSKQYTYVSSVIVYFLSLIFSASFFHCFMFRTLKILIHLVLPVIKLSFFASSFIFLWHNGAFPCAFKDTVQYVYLCVLIYVDVFQCLQRIWKRALGRWRGSCCSWKETWRHFPPLMTPTTCSSLKWLYPLHMHAFPGLGNWSVVLV